MFFVLFGIHNLVTFTFAILFVRSVSCVVVEIICSWVLIVSSACVARVFFFVAGLSIERSILFGGLGSVRCAAWSFLACWLGDKNCRCLFVPSCLRAVLGSCFTGFLWFDVWLLETTVLEWRVELVLGGRSFWLREGVVDSIWRRNVFGTVSSWCFCWLRIAYWVIVFVLLSLFSRCVTLIFVNFHRFPISRPPSCTRSFLCSRSSSPRTIFCFTRAFNSRHLRRRRCVFYFMNVLFQRICNFSALLLLLCPCYRRRLRLVTTLRCWWNQILFRWSLWLMQTRRLPCFWLMIGADIISVSLIVIPFRWTCIFLCSVHVRSWSVRSASLACFVCRQFF